MTRKGIILAGGAGTRLHPLTTSISKQLLPVFDKPMIYYPLSTLMLAGIQDILLITTPRDAIAFQHLLGDGSKFGINLQYAEQPSPDGIAQAFLIGKSFIGKNTVSLILGDNIFHSDTFINKYLIPSFDKGLPTVFGYHVADPERYGVVEFDEKNNILSIEEKIEFQSNPVLSSAFFLFALY